MESLWPVSKLSTESVGSRRELVVNCVHTADADATKQFRPVGVGGVYWALGYTEPNCTDPSKDQILHIRAVGLIDINNSYRTRRRSESAFYLSTVHFRGHVTLATPSFRKFCKVSCPDC